MADIRETSLTIDHDMRIVMIDTTEKGMATLFRKIGLEEITDKSSRHFFRFKGNSDLIRIRKKKNVSKDSHLNLKGSKKTGNGAK